MCKNKHIEKLALSPGSLNVEILPPSRYNNPKILPQFFASCAISLGGLNAGTVNAWSGGALTQIDEEFDFSAGYLAFIASVITLGSLVGSLCSAKLTDIFGRRAALLLSPPVLICGWIFIALSPNLAFIYVGRFLCGLAVGVLLSTCNVYISEISSPAYRGRLSSLNTIFLTFGILLSYISTGFLTWRISCYFFMSTSVLMFLCVFLIPESPYWFLKKGLKDQAIRSMQWLRGKNYDYTEELKEMQTKIGPSHIKSNYKEFLRRRTRIPLLIGMFVQVCQQLCGGNIIMLYTSVVFKNSNSSIEVKYGTMSTGIFQLLGTIVSIMVIDKIGRKPVLTTSLLGVSVAMFVLGIGFRMENIWPTWLPLVTILFCVFTFCLGLRPIPWIISSELLNTSVRSTGTAICVFFNRVLSFTTLQVYPYYRNWVGDDGVFITYGCTSLLLAILTPYIVLETNNKSLEEIQEHFEKVPTKKRKSEEAAALSEELA